MRSQAFAAPIPDPAPVTSARLPACGIYPFHRKRVTPDFYGVNVHCLADFDAEGVLVRHTDGIGMA